MGFLKERGARTSMLIAAIDRDPPEWLTCLSTEECERFCEGFVAF